MPTSDKSPQTRKYILGVVITFSIIILLIIISVIVDSSIEKSRIDVHETNSIALFKALIAPLTGGAIGIGAGLFSEFLRRRWRGKRE
jgi:hypothetical protein